MSKTISAWDLKISLWVQTLSYQPLKNLLSFISWIGYPPQGFLFALFLLLIETRTSFYFGLISLFAFVYLIKALTKRLRPTSHQNLKVSRTMKSASFPSSHTATYTYIFGHLIHLVQTSSFSPIINLTLTLTLTIIILLVGPSRIYRGEHWASDTIAGYLLGFIWLWLTIQ